MVLVSLHLSLGVSVYLFEEGTALFEMTGKVKRRAAHLSEKTSAWTQECSRNAYAV